MGWSRDGSEVLFRSYREQPRYAHDLYAVPVTGGDARKLPLGWAAQIDIDPASGLWAFNRRSRDGRTWKRYRGGWATDVWVGHPDRQDYRQVTDFAGMDAHPAWHGGRVYFVSDRGGTANIWSILPDGSDRRRHTEYDEWDVRYPGMGPAGRMVYMLAGDLHVFDAGTGTVAELDIDLPSERLKTRNRYPDAARYATWYDLSPKADRVLVTSRGELFSVPVEKGVTLPITRGSGARESWGDYHPDGDRVAYVTDATGEEAIHAIDAWGRGEAEVLKKPGDLGWHLPPLYSPDGEWIAFADETETLYVLPADGGKPKRVDESGQWEIREYSWSPDGRWLAYSVGHVNHYVSIKVYDTDEETVHALTDSTTYDFSPAWDPDGDYLYFLSDRDVRPIMGWKDFDFIETHSTKPYMVLLREDVDHPFEHREGLPVEDEDDSDEEDEDDEEEVDDDDADEDEEEEDDDELDPVDIDWYGIGNRIVELPVEPGNYGGLQAASGKVFYISMPILGMSDDRGPDSRTLMSFDLEEEEADVFVSGVNGYQLASEADKMLLIKGRGDIYVVGTGSSPDDLGDARVSLADLIVELDPDEEWAQIFYESWRHQRDFYWDEGMGGVDWKAMRDKYAALLPRLSTRSDVRDLVGEMIGELATSHTYVRGGDYLLAVNHQPFPADRSFYASFQGLANKQVLLTVSDSPEGDSTWQTLVTTLTGDRRLLYADWVRRNREYVTQKTNGEIGYMHLPDMSNWGMDEFITWYYPQVQKKGMVVDIRWNGGGFTSQLFVKRFQRALWAAMRSRHGNVWEYPQGALHGPFVVVLNQSAGSDGDIFPRSIQLLGLAPIIGKRSWGGVVGIRNNKRMVDGGVLTEPEAAFWDYEQGWEVENHGVDPDIEVENLPQELAAGVDAQLDRAIEEVQRLRRENPPRARDFGPATDRSRRAFRHELGQD